MTQIINNYARILYELGIEPDMIQETKHRFLLTKELQKALTSPVISKETKHALIRRIFHKRMHSFLLVLNDYHSMSLLPQILTAYEQVYFQENKILTATLSYVTEPDEQQLKRFESYLKKRFSYQRVYIKMKQDPELVGGFILKVGDLEMDWSLRGRFKRLEQKLTRR